MVRIKERELVIPALMTIKNNPGITTSGLIKELNDILKPTGKDNQKIKNRNDTHFSQKVRNLKSHNTLELFTNYVDEQGWFINAKGEEYLSFHSEQVKAYEDLLVKNFTYNQVVEFFTEIESKDQAINEQPKIYYYDEDVEIQEGIPTLMSTKRRKRSKYLRDKALEYYSNDDNSIECSICGFDFVSKYGEIGKGFIEIHHKKPIYQYENTDVSQLLKDAIGQLMPVCSNCHRMLHRDKNMNEDTLKTLVKLKQSNNVKN